MKGFLADLYLRPSCHACAFKTKQRQADITLADFWGIQNVLPQLDDNQGTSVIWLHTKKGNTLFQRILPELKCEKIAVEQAIIYNAAAVTSAREPANRKRFWAAFHGEFPVEAIDKLSKRTLYQRMQRYLARLKRKLKV